MNLDRDVAAVRLASRKIVREVGILNSLHAESGLSASQCHALIELDVRGEIAPGKLAEILRLDPSSITRLLQPMAKKGLIVAERNDFDGRKLLVRLTAEGRARVNEIHRQSNTQVKEALRGLSEENQAKVVEGLEVYSRALERARLRQGITMRIILPADDGPLAKLIRETMEEFGVLGPGTAHADVEVDEMHRIYTAPRHIYYVLKQDGVVVGGAGIGPLAGGSRETCELRKMYLRPEVRGMGLGADLLQACLKAAKSLLYRRCYLETMTFMHQARALYERAGFVECPGPQGHTGHTKCDAWYMREL